MEFLSRCPEKFHCPVPLETLVQTYDYIFHFRYPEGFSELSENMTNTYHIDNNSSNIQISVTGSSQYGWIEGSNSTFNFNIRNGILVKIGIESNLDETNSFKVNSVRKDGRDKIVQLYENSVLEIIGQLRLHYISYDA